MEKVNDADVQKIIEWRKSPLAFVKDIWGLTPVDNQFFVKGKHITRQQEQILKAVETSLSGLAPRRISVASGHGIGKSSCLSWLILWFLFCFRESQVSCTAPTSQQMYDILWKEVAKWKKLMPPEIENMFEWSTTYVRIKESPETWFARAVTARKESPEALAGVHGNHVLLLADESSGVPEEIFDTARGALTNKNVLVVLISNPTRLIGYFYDSHHSLSNSWQTLQFSSLESPLVDEENEMIKEIRQKYGEDSDEWRIRVLGLFPKEEGVDERGFLPLFPKRLVEEAMIDDSHEFRSAGNPPLLSIDPAGEGKDKTVWAIRDNFVLKKLADENISSDKTIAEKTIKFIDYYGIPLDNIFIDGFGTGARIAQEIEFYYRQLGELHARINIVLTSEKAEDEQYLNIRAETAFRLRDFLAQGGQLVRDKCWAEFNLIRYLRVERSGKIKLMDKEQMRKLLHASPDYFDAASLLFVRMETHQESGSWQYTPRLRF